MFGLSEVALILLVVVIVLGAKKLPELTRSAGKATRILKAEARAVKEQGTETGPRAERVVRGVVVERSDRAPRP